MLSLTLGLYFGLRNKNNKNNMKNVGAIVSNGRGCAEIGGDMLKMGGSAVDAAISVLLCEGVMLPHSMGVGGGFVATVYTKSTGKIETLIAREAAPAAAHKDMFVGQSAIVGARAGGVPGELLGYWELHRKYGRLSWRTLFQPIIKLCKEGHWVSKFLANALVSKEKEVRAEPSMAEIFVKEDGTLYKEGEYMKRTQLGNTFEVIAENGIGELYDGGELGKMFAEDIQALGGLITEKDLRSYKPRWDDTHSVMANITNDLTLHTTPLPSSGAQLAFILNVMHNFYIEDHNTYWQRVVEAFKHSFGQRAYLGDAEKEPFLADTIKQTFDNLISVDFAKQKRLQIKDNETSEDSNYYGANFTTVEDHGTASMAVLADNGDAVTISSTVNNFFGCKVRSSRTGIILNDVMDDFSTPGLVNSFGVPASPTNFIYPGKIPVSSMCPSIILDKEGDVRMLVGAAGGTRISTSVATTIFKYLILEESLEEAVNGGRLHHQLAPMRLDMESEVPESLRAHLLSIGHKGNVLPAGSGFAALTAIGVRDGVPQPIYDRRRVGSIAIIAREDKYN